MTLEELKSLRKGNFVKSEKAGKGKHYYCTSHAQSMKMFPHKCSIRIRQGSNILEINERTMQHWEVVKDDSSTTVSTTGI